MAAAMRNPGELLVFGNPPKGHKRGCKCFACKRARSKKNPGELLIFVNPAKKVSAGDRVVFHGYDGKDYNATVKKIVRGFAVLEYNVPGTGTVTANVHRKDWPRRINPSKLAAQRAARDRAARIRGARANQGRLIDAVRFGDRVTIVDRFGQQHTGRAVMRSSTGGWVLNMGGAHGTPGLADDRNVVRVKRSKNPVRMTVFHDPAIKKFTAAIYDPKFGNLYASGFTKKQAAQALRERVREYRRSGSLPAGGGYGNPTCNPKGGFGTHKKGCACVFCQHQRKIAAVDRRMPKPVRDVMRANPRRRRKDRKRRNPDETKQAVKLFQSFHGRDPKDITEKHVSAEMRKDYAAVGDLEYLKVVTPLGQTVKFNFEGDGVKLASSPDGKQLYCIGGNQNLSQCLTADSLQKDFIDLGECVEVQYLARKIHGNFDPTSYFHKFGEKTGERPQLAYDKLRKLIFFVGGAYFINARQGVSPGIEN